MKQIISLLAVALLIAIPSTTLAQHYSLQGKVMDQHHVPVEFMEVRLLNTDSLPVQSAFTDSLGQFSLRAESGTYWLVLQEFGAEFTRMEVLLNQNTDLGEITVQEAQELQGVTITGRKKTIEQQVDRLVFHVENTTSITGGTALDALKATPTVRVQNDNISIVGKGEVLVMVDDRLQRMSQEDLATFLKSIPAANIKSIEVITTPPAKYDAEGNSGLINIRLKKARANSWNADLGTSYTQKTYAGGNAQGLFNYNHNKLALQLSANRGQQQLLTTSDEQVFYPTELWTQRVSNRSNSNWLGLGMSIDYKLTKKWTTGMHYLGNSTDRTAANQPLTTRFNAADQSINGYIASDVSSGNTNAMHSVNWYHSFALDSLGKTLSFDFDYFQYNKTDARAFSGSSLHSDKTPVSGTAFSSTTNNSNRIQNYAAKTDLSLPYDWANLSCGAKLSHTLTGNDLAVYDYGVLNTDQSNVFSYREFNEAFYVSGSKKLHERWETQIGLRVEATQTEGYSRNLDQTNTNNYVRIFPTAYVTYVPSDTNSFSLNYSRRIRRPDFDYLNPFIIRTSPYFYSEGNPFLKPSFIDNIELSWIKNQKWVSSVYYSQVSDFGQELSIIDPVTNITRTTPMNYANTYQIGFSTYYNFSKWACWNSFSGFNANYQNVNSKTSVVQSIDGFNAYCYTNNDFTLNRSKTIFLGLNYAVQLPGRYQIFHISSMHMLDISMKFLMLDKKLSLGLVCEDLLNAQRPLIAYSSNSIQNTIKSYSDTRGFRISISYRFSNNVIQSRERSFGNAEEKERTE